jgi:hypothetical protein
MRAQAHKFQTVVIRLSVEKDEIRPDVTIAVILPAGDRNYGAAAAHRRRAG